MLEKLADAQASAEAEAQGRAAAQAAADAADGRRRAAEEAFVAAEATLQRQAADIAALAPRAAALDAAESECEDQAAQVRVLQALLEDATRSLETQRDGLSAAVAAATERSERALTALRRSHAAELVAAEQRSSEQLARTNHQLAAVTSELDRARADIVAMEHRLTASAAAELQRAQAASKEAIAAAEAQGLLRGRKESEIAASTLKRVQAEAEAITARLSADLKASEAARVLLQDRISLLEREARELTPANGLAAATIANLEAQVSVLSRHCA